MKPSSSLCRAIADTTGLFLDRQGIPAAPGRRTSTATAVRDEEGLPWFLKLSRSDGLSMLEAERDGLLELAERGSVRVPGVMGCGAAGEVAWLLMECLDLGGDRRLAAADMGRQLAQTHRISAEEFGWYRDNTIGLTHQTNTRDSDWISFFAQHRLGFQLQLARDNGYANLFDPGMRLADHMGGLFDAYSPAPSLLHGDLWGGNWGATSANEPVMFDPAVYYGDRETDLAMTRLFGGFPEDFYSAYQEAWPLDEGFRVRERLYKLYHVLNHLNLFGGGYLDQAQDMVSGLLAELGR